MSQRKNPKITFDKLLMDQDFIDHLKYKNTGYQGKDMIEKDPELRSELEKASFIFHILSSHKRIKFPDELKKAHVERLIKRIQLDEMSGHNKSRYVIQNVLKVAASIIVIIGLSILISLKVISPYRIANSSSTIEMVVPSGEKSQIILADGSSVWLNSDSKLVYPISFKGDDRKVILEGEAYFDVKKVRNSRFVVVTQDFKVEVLGTKFNVKSYPDDPTMETTVVEGMVRVEPYEDKLSFSPIILKPSERMVFLKANQQKPQNDNIESRQKQAVVKPVIRQEILISHVNTDNITCWKDHLLVFDNETLEQIALKMSRWYKIQVEIMDDDLKSHRYTGKFIYNESIIQVLEAIDLTTPIKYKIYQNTVEIRRKNK